MLFVQGLLSVAIMILILNVIMNERGFVETLHGNGNLLDVLGNRLTAIISECLVSGNG